MRFLPHFVNECCLFRNVYDENILSRHFFIYENYKFPIILKTPIKGKAPDTFASGALIKGIRKIVTPVLLLSLNYCLLVSITLTFIDLLYTCIL